MFSGSNPSGTIIPSACRGIATVSVFLTGGFSFDDELEYMHLNPRGKGWGYRDLGAQDELSAISFALPPVLTDN